MEERKFDEKKVEDLTNQLFIRSQKSSSNKHLKNCLVTQEVIEANLAGSIILDNGIKWKILGMRAKTFSPNLATEYDVYRIPCEWNVNGSMVCETMPHRKRCAVMKLCRYDSAYDHKQLLNEREILLYIRNTLDQKRHLDCFPCLLGQGVLDTLYYRPVRVNSFYHGKRSNIKVEKENEHSRVVPPIPRPFIIVEKFEPSLDTILNSSKEKKMNIGTSSYLILGCIEALRHLHHLGIVHRNVQPANFSLRHHPSGLLHRRESELSYSVVITDFSLCRLYRSRKIIPRKVVKFIGNYKYSLASPEAMLFQEQTSVDDIISCLYMLHELCTGTLPWSKTRIRDNIIKEKKILENNNYMMNGSDVILPGVKILFKIVRNANGYTHLVNYSKLRESIVNLQHESSSHSSLFGFRRKLMNSHQKVHYPKNE